MRAGTAKRVGVYAGSFDPLTIGHLWMIRQGVLLFDRLIVGLGTNPEKRYTFTTEERMRLLQESLKSFKNITVASFSNRYLIEFAQSVGATHVLRGIRSESDYEYERTMRHINGDLDGAICTIFLMPPRDIAEVSSSMVKSLVGPQGWEKVVRKYVPGPVYECLLGLQEDRPGLLSPAIKSRPSQLPGSDRRARAGSPPPKK